MGHYNSSFIISYISEHGNKSISVYGLRIHPERGNDYYCIGEYHVPLQMFGEYLLIEDEDSPAIIPVNILHLYKFVNMAKECNLYARTKMIVCGYPYINNYSTGSCNFLRGREVVIICSPGCDEWKSIVDIVEICKKYNPRKISIYPWPIYTSGLQFDFNGYSSSCTAILNDRKINLDEVEIFSNFCKKIVNNSITFDDKFSEWKSSIGLNPATEPIGEVGLLRPIDIFSDEYNISESCKEISLCNFFSPDLATMIWGRSGVGKSKFALGVAIA